MNLVGGAIASTNATNSELTAQTLNFSDLQNQMQHSTSSGSISGGYGGAMEGNTPVFAGATPNFGGGVPMHEKGGDSSTTYATLTEGNIVIGGKKVTAAELGVNTDAATTHRAIEAMPNAELQLANQQAMAAAMGTVVATSKQIAGDIGNQAMRDLENSYLSTLSDEEKDRFKSQSAEGKSNELAARFPYSYSDAVAQQQNWGIGSQNGRALEAVTTLLVGVVSGQGGGQVAANALAPYAAQLIGSKFDTDHGSDPDAAAQALSHALLGAVLAELNGGSAGGGALSAAGGELAAGFLKDAFPNADRETISALSQAVGALAAGVAGGTISHAALGAGIAKNSVENNRLLNDIELARIKELSNGDVLREAELTAAACALVKCSSGFAEGSEEWAQWAAIEALGSTPEAQDDRDWMKAQVQPGYLYTAGNGLATENKLFGYDAADYLFDWSSRNQVGTRTLGGLQAVGGSLPGGWWGATASNL
ncbi:VENN motif pre-toxin domain-containing protein [Stenotrophomonas rhizophila]